MSSTSVTATELITRALDALGLYAVGETIAPEDLADGRLRLNGMLSTWSLQDLATPPLFRQTFPVTANRIAYSVGPGLALPNWDWFRPRAVIRAGLVQPDGLEINTPLLTQDAYNSIPYKLQTDERWQYVAFGPTYSVNGGATILLWPVPTTADNDCVLYAYQPIAEFDDLTTAAYIPDGYYEAIIYGLAERLAGPHGMKVPEDVRRMAIETLGNAKRNTMRQRQSDLRNDAALIGVRAPWGYDIYSDTTRS